MSQHDMPPSLVDRAVHRWWMPALGLLLGAGLGLLSVVITPTTYSTTATVQMSDVGATVAGLAPRTGDALRNVATTQSVLSSEAVATEASVTLGRRPSIAIGTVGGDVLSVTATAPDAGTASQDANTLVDAFFTVTEQQLRDQVQPVALAVTTRLDEIAQELADIAAQEAALQQQEGPTNTVTLAQLAARRSALFEERGGLSTQSGRINSLLLLGNPYVQRLSPASAEEAVSQPDARNRLVLGAVAGAALGVAVSLLPPRRRRATTRRPDQDEGADLWPAP